MYVVMLYFEYIIYICVCYEMHTFHVCLKSLSCERPSNSFQYELNLFRMFFVETVFLVLFNLTFGMFLIFTLGTFILILAMIDNSTILFLANLWYSKGFNF